MLEPGTLRGARGLVKHAWHTAAEVTGFLITFDRATHTAALGGTVTASDAYWLTQVPLVFVMPTKTGAWRWPIESCAVTDGRLTARLGALLERE